MKKISQVNNQIKLDIEMSPLSISDFVFDCPINIGFNIILVHLSSALLLPVKSS